MNGDGWSERVYKVIECSHVCTEGYVDVIVEGQVTKHEGCTCMSGAKSKVNVSPIRPQARLNGCILGINSNIR